MSDKREAIQQKFEQALLDGLAGNPVIAKDGTPVIDPGTEEILKTAPEASFLSVVRAYLKDLMGPSGEKETLPKAGQGKGLLAKYEKSMPFGARPN